MIEEKKVRILVVDDSELMQYMIKEIISGGKYQIVGTALSGLEAIDQYNTLLPDVVTMDINVPDIDGIDVVKEILKIDPEAKIIMCSGRDGKADIKNALEAGAYGYIHKPFLMY